MSEKKVYIIYVHVGAHEDHDHGTLCAVRTEQEASDLVDRLNQFSIVFQEFKDNLIQYLEQYDMWTYREASWKEKRQKARLEYIQDNLNLSKDLVDVARLVGNLFMEPYEDWPDEMSFQWEEVSYYDGIN